MKNQEQQLEIHCGNRNGLSYREIGRRKGCDPRTAKKYAQHPELIGKPRQTAPRGSMVDPYLDQIEAYLIDGDGNHRASFIYDQLVKCGFTGSYEIVKRVVSQKKGRQQQIAYVRFETIPGCQAQVDFGEFVVTQPDGIPKKYFLFAMILGYSRKMYVRLLEKCDLPSFLESHQLAFEHFGGAPAEILYDRMRNVYIREIAVEKGTGGSSENRPQFTQGLVTVAVHYGFKPMVAPAYSPWVKGKIERPMEFIRESFWRGYEFTDLARANQDLWDWMAQKDQRVHGTTGERVDLRFEREKPHLRPLPPSRCDVSLRLTRQVSKDCTIRVDGNRYIVPHTLVGQVLTIRIADGHLRFYNGGDLVEEYDAPKGKGQLVGLDRGHYDRLRQDKALQARKFGCKTTAQASEDAAGQDASGKARGKQKGRARIKMTISPTVPPHDVVVETITVSAPTMAAMATVALTVQRRSLDTYNRLGGEVGYA